MNSLVNLRPWFNPVLLDRARVFGSYLGADPGNLTSIPALRIEAARNLGITPVFTAATGRQFTGSVSDYSDLTADQQTALTDEMLKLIRSTPSSFTPAQVSVAAAQTRPLAQPTAAEQVTSWQAAGQGASEGLQAATGAVQGLLSGTVSFAGGLVGTAYQGVTGETIGGTVTKILLIAAGAGVLYLLAQSFLRKKGIT
jgi:hypothetical protein